MMVPGSNILNRALKLLTAQTITYLAFVSRSTTAIGTQVPVYATAVQLRGSIQPVPRQLMEILGLDLQKHYVNIFVSNNVIDVARDVSSDKFKFGGATFQAISITKWRTVDGWNQVLAVEVPQ